MRQFLLPGELKANSSVTVRGSDYHYLLHVLRLKPGETFHGISRDGRTCLVRLDRVAAGSIHLKVVSVKQPENPACGITLLQCLPKGKKMDLIVRMATETGVRAIVPLVSDYTLPGKKDLGRLKGKISRWQIITEQALQQSGTVSLPKVWEPLCLDDFIGRRRSDEPAVFCHQEPLADTSLHELLRPAPAALSVLIGPEGGFSERETDLLTKNGFVPVYLGNSVLRTETAAVFVLAAIKIILLEKGTWSLPQK